MQQLRVQIETQTLKEEIKEDLKGKAEEMKQIGEEVRHLCSRCSMSTASTGAGWWLGRSVATAAAGGCPACWVDCMDWRI